MDIKLSNSDIAELKVLIYSYLNRYTSIIEGVVKEEIDDTILRLVAIIEEIIIDREIKKRNLQ